MINAWWHSNIRARAFIACAGRLWSGFYGIYSENDLLFSLFFFSKKSQENKKWGYQVSPAVGGEETGGFMRPVLV